MVLPSARSTRALRSVRSPPLVPRSRNHLDGEERRLLERAEARVRLVAGIPVVMVVSALAAAEVLVLAVPGESVEARDRFGECVDGHADLPGQFGDGAGLDDDTGLQPATGERGPRGDAGERVPVAVPLVEDEPARDVLARPVALAVRAAVHRVRRLDVRCRFVDEALAGFVDHDAAGQAPLGQREPRSAGERDGRAPPTRPPSDRARHRAFRRPRCRRPCWLSRRRSTRCRSRPLVLLAGLVVVLEAARRDHHAAARPEHLRLSVDRGVDALDHTVFHVQVGERGVEQDRDAAAFSPACNPATRA